MAGWRGGTAIDPPDLLFDHLFLTYNVADAYLSPTIMQPTNLQWPALSLICAIALATPPVWSREPSHGLSYFGDLKYGPDIAHFDLRQSGRAQGWTHQLPGVGTFNNLNPYVDKGRLAYNISPRGGLGSYILDPLMRKCEDELASYYAWLAESVEVADDYSWVTYKLRENAYWHDGRPVTIEDVLWTFDTIKTKGSITWRTLYKEIVRLEQIDDWSFRFHFSDEAEKTPQLVIETATFAPLPKHYWETRAFDETTLEPPLGNGAYRIGAVDPGYKVVFERVEDYWARDLNFAAGYFNFDEVEFIWFFDKRVMLQALRAGVFDYFFEENESDWATAYDFEGHRKGLFKKETYTMGFAYGMHFGTVLNTRRAPLDDIRVREALTLAYNFEWANRVFWHDGMIRNNSFFVRSGLQAFGPPSAEELELLERFRGQLPESVFTNPIELPKNNPFGRNRETLLRADALLEEAGWVVKDFRRVHAVTGEPFALEFIVGNHEHERMLTPFVENLERLGIVATLRRIEGNAMTNRLRTYDYDATVRKVYTWKVPFPTPMKQMFTSGYVDTPTMRNYAGIKHPVVDSLVETITKARSVKVMNTAGRALDRVLLHNFYVIPDGHPVGRHMVYWDRFGHPPIGVPHMNWQGIPYLWWFDEEKSARVDAGIAALKEN